jgi:hypothetical protein
MRKTLGLLAALFLAPAAPAAAQDIAAGTPLAEACRHIPAVPDACALIAEATTMLAPTYRVPKQVGEAELRQMRYAAQYIPARWGLRPTTDVFLVGRPASGRLFVVITGTESTADWLSNAWFRLSTGTYADGEFYGPPGHSGFRGGLRNIVQYGVLHADEFAASRRACDQPAPRRSYLAQFLCTSQIQRDDEPVELVIVGHSRGAGIGLISATAFMGLEFRRSAAGGPVTVAPQPQWPLRLHAIIGIAPPYAIARRSDRAAGMNVPPGVPDHDAVLDQYGIPDRTILIANDRDVVPLLSFGQALHRGHLFRVRRDRSVVYERMLRAGRAGTSQGETPDGGLAEAHSSAGYCHDILHALGAFERCDEREAVPND